jgi:hypothetical protein
LERIAGPLMRLGLLMRMLMPMPMHMGLLMRMLKLS